jgi:hypothetical protein
MGREEAAGDLSVGLQVNGARLARLKSYFFETPEDAFYPTAATWKCRARAGDLDVVVAWLDGASRDSEIVLTAEDRDVRFTVGDLLDQPEVRLEPSGGYVSANLLRHDEIGPLRLRDVGVEPQGEDFDLVVFCDTHVAGEDSDFDRYLRANIERVNALRPRPALLLINGDSTTGQGEEERFRALEALLARCGLPVLLGLGNHECRYKSTFGPGYNMEALSNFFEGQRRINGTEKILYSFDLGRWHFVVFPDPLRQHFWETHPHYFEWLARDLRDNSDRPTIIFKHIHPLPIGINPMTNYVNSVQVRRMFLDLVTRHGNVKYVLTGHTHIPLRASLKTARSYRGVNFINLPPTFSPGRAFGEPDPDGHGPAGCAVLSFRGRDVRIRYHALLGGTLQYPRAYSEFRPDRWPVWLNQDWQLPAGSRFANGGFEQDLEGWARRFVYVEDQDPSYVCRTDDAQAHGGNRSLYLFCRRRGYYVPGDNRMAQTIHSIRQAVKMPEKARPLVEAWYRLDGQAYTPGDLSGACIRVEGYSGAERKVRLCYWIGTGYFKPRGMWSDWEEYHHFDVTAGPDRWHEVVISVARDYARATDGGDLSELDLDRLVLTLQVWNLNQHLEEQEDAGPMRIGLHFDDVAVTFPEGGPGAPSAVDGEPVMQKPEEEIDSEWRIAPMGPTWPPY